MDAYARWRREVDCEVAFRTGGMMTADVDFDWDRAFARGYPPDEVAHFATRTLYTTV